MERKLMTNQCKELPYRHINYDFLRIICTIAVIMIHVSATYKGAYTDDDAPYKYHIITTIVYNTLSRFAVPCFMMLSGALLLSNEKNKDYKCFYRKSFVNIGIPTFIFSILYFAYSTVIVLINIAFKGESFMALLKPLYTVIIGAPFYHLWYLYTLLGVYLIIPLILKIKGDIGQKYFTIFSWIYFLIAIASGFTSSYKLNWGISKVVCYLGFILAGYQIKLMTNKKNNLKGIGCIIIAFLLLLILSYIQYGHTLDLIVEENEEYSLIGNFNPIVVIASILIFVGFSLLSLKSIKIEKLSKDTFIIYLFHAGVWEIGSTVLFEFTGGKTNPRYTIPLGIIIVFFVSWGLCRIYNRLWAFIIQNKKPLYKVNASLSRIVSKVKSTLGTK